MRDKQYKPDKYRIEVMYDWHHAGGDCICDVCGFKYYDHQPVPGYMWLRKLCDGSLVKL